MRDTRVAWVLAACMLGVVGMCAFSSLYIPIFFTLSPPSSLLRPSTITPFSIAPLKLTPPAVCSAGEVTLYIQCKVSGDDNFGQPVRIIFSIVPGLVANLVCAVLRTERRRRSARAE